MKRSVQSLVEAYARMERRLHAEVAALSAGVCAGCRKVCCTPEHCADFATSPWLRRVAAVALGTGSALPRRRRGGFLSVAGCTLLAGRPMQCTLYVCDRIDAQLTDPLKRFLYEVLSRLLVYVVRDVAGHNDLTEIKDLDALSASQRKKIAARIATADRCLDVCGGLRAGQDGECTAREVCRQVLYLASLHPFAAQRAGAAAKTAAVAAREGLANK